MNKAGKIFLGLAVAGLIAYGVFYFSKPKDIPKGLDLDEDDGKKIPETTSSASGEISEPDELKIEDPAPVVKVQNVISVSTANVYKAMVDEKGSSILNGGVLYQAKTNTKIGEFVKNVLVYGYPHVLAKDASGNEVLINKTYTKIE